MRMTNSLSLVLEFDNTVLLRIEVLDLQERVGDRGSPGLLVMRGGRVLDKMGGVCGLRGAPAMSPWTSQP